MTMFEKLLAFSRHNKMAMLALMDALLLPLALWSAVFLRLGGYWDPKLNPHLWIFIVPPRCGRFQSSSSWACTARCSNTWTTKSS
ncbi:hypothetical protein JOS77_17220 [Chromobacterium haemolyticum]|nr:hypothetical protein JOS77_17220 [Chromobacterium haemolyticum]